MNTSDTTHRARLLKHASVASYTKPQVTVFLHRYQTGDGLPRIGFAFYTPNGARCADENFSTELDAERCARGYVHSVRTLADAEITFQWI